LKYCDNAKCPYFIRVNKYAEYRDEVNKCSDCGSVLKKGERPDLQNKEQKEIDPIVNISSYRDLQDAYLAKGKLESEGIKVFLKNEYTIGVQWLYSGALGGVKLDVPKSQAQQALDILREDKSEEIIKQSNNRNIKNNDVCPICKSTNIQYYERSRKFGALTLLTGIPLILFGKRYKCLDCNHKWKPK